MVMKSTVRSDTVPGFVMPGTPQMSGESVASSRSANFRQWCFSPMCQPWSLQKQMIVLSL
jgi:hypothetical protein